ncbi:MAG TPA: thioredoxin domain-containing protein [Gemmatimonadales bacterium]|jgi:protein-disulfide isomerase
MTTPAPAITGDDHVLGQAGARVTLMEYGDFECPSCGATHPILREVRRAFGPNLRFIFRHYPLRDNHPHAEMAAQAAEAAAAQGKFWEMHDRLYEHQDALDQRGLTRHARKIGVDVAKFETDLAARTYATRVERDVESGRASGVRGTPSLFINGVIYRGPRDRASLVAALANAAMAPAVP